MGLHGLLQGQVYFLPFLQKAKLTLIFHKNRKKALKICLENFLMQWIPKKLFEMIMSSDLPCIFVFLKISDYNVSNIFMITGFLDFVLCLVF
jgi:hypothetical protein